MRVPRSARESALIKAAGNGNARICIAFGGQGPRNPYCLADLTELHTTHGAVLHELIQVATATLSELVALPHNGGFHDNCRFDISRWLDDPASAPAREYLALAPVSFPMNTLISLAEYCVTCQSLGLDPGQLQESLAGVIGHSQGMFAAAAVASADSWTTFYDAVRFALRLSFHVGQESHYAAPPSKVSATATTDCIDHGEGEPSYMLGVGGLDRAQMDFVVARVNKSMADEREEVRLALVNARDKFVVAGPPQALRAVCVHLREVKAASGVDQTRMLFNQRKPEVLLQFLPISAPYHTAYLDGVEERVKHALPSMSLRGNELGVPLYHPQTAKNLQDMHSDCVVGALIRSVCAEALDWPRVCRSLQCTHVLAFGPGSVGRLVHETTEGSGVCVVQMNDRSTKSAAATDSATDFRGPAELYSVTMPPQVQSWRSMFAPRLVQDNTEKGRPAVRLQTRMTEMLGAPPTMVAGMTPTTVAWKFTSAVIQAGYHVELAGGGYATEQAFEHALRQLASAIPAHRGITCNLLYASPTTIAWQVSVLRRLVAEGIPIVGMTVGAGIPSPDVVKDYIESIGLKHISFKPGSQAAIEQVIDIAQQYPDYPIGLQWTGGRAGGHHSYEDFHQPILKTYARIRRCSNLVLIAGSGFGGAADTIPYLTGEWAQRFDYPCMPFDGIMFGSRMMVAREAQTSIQAKRLIVEAEGVLDPVWHRSYESPAGGVVTITSEMGQPIHMLATRGVMLWKEFDQRIFSIKDSAKRLKYLQLHREEIISRLNKDYAKPWFAVDRVNQNVEIEDMTYSEVLRRLCQLMYVSHQRRWAHPSYQRLVRDSLHILEERFGFQVDGHLEDPVDIIDATENLLGPSASEVLYPQDVALLMALFRRRGQKPVPFIPKLDESFETWFKKDSLWQSEDVEAVVDQDVQRICIIQGPVAAQYSTTCEESAKQILDDICQQHVQLLQQNVDYHVQSATGIALPQPLDFNSFPGVKVTRDRSKRKYELLQTGELPDSGPLASDIAGTQSWLSTILSAEWVYSESSRSKNPVRQAFSVRRGEIIEVQLTDDASPCEVTLSAGTEYSRPNTRSTITVSSTDGKSVAVTLSAPDSVNSEPSSIQFTFEVRRAQDEYRLVDTSPDRIGTIRRLYAQLWTGGLTKSLQYAGLGSEIHGDDAVVSEPELQEYLKVIKQAGPSKIQSWTPTGVVPLEYCIVIAWKALTKPLMISGLDCDLLKLLHKSVNFKYMKGVRPLEIGDVLSTTSRIISLAIQPTGKLVEVSADIWRSGQLVVVVKSEFFIQGKFDDYGRQFTSVEEPEMVVNVQSEVVRSLLLSRKWLTMEDPTIDLIGKSVVFHLHSHTVFDPTSKHATLQVSGTASTDDHTENATGIGTVYFEHDSCEGNPVMDFLKRHGANSAERLDLENAGQIGDESMTFRAPAQSCSYARVSQDNNPIHVSPVFARYAGLPGPVVHGMETAAIVKRMVEWMTGDAGGARFRRWRVSFEDMVQHGELLRVELQHLAMEQGMMILRVQVFKDGGQEKVMEAQAAVEQPRTAYLFCGQGSQEKGMGMSLYASEPDAKALWERGDNFLREKYGFSIIQIVRDNPQSLTVKFGGKRGRYIRDNYMAMTQKSSLAGGDVKEDHILPGLTPRSSSHTFSFPKGLLFSTPFSQPALALMEMAQYRHLQAQGVVQSDGLFAGHSLGEYAALGACTTFMPFERLLELIFYRGLKMQNALERDAQGRTDYSMMAVDPSRVGEDFDEQAFENLVNLIARESGLLLEVVNRNISSQQYVCAGNLQSLYILGQACDELARHSSIRSLGAEDLQNLVRRLIPTAQHISNDVPLERGQATIPLNGIDIPFHSKMLRAEIPIYRDYLSTKITASDIEPEELVDRWVPNVVGKPFSLDREYVQHVQKVTGSERLGELLQSLA